MAHVVGVPKRDPCHKCNLPVFLAERLAVGKRIYHRTCLKCARCGSQLTPGSFYETENDGEYVCETCPDEELINDNAGASLIADNSAPDYEVELRGATAANSTLAPPARTARSSIAERLAFFEQNKTPSQQQLSAVDQKLLQKSVSDEEKSQSLKRMEQHEASYKPSNAFSKFMHDDVDSELRAETPDASETATTATTSSETRMDTSDTEAELDEPDLNEVPQLPATDAPTTVATDETPTTPKLAPKPRFTATAALELKTETEHVAPKSMLKRTELQMQLSDATNNNSQHNNDDEQTTTPTTTLDLSISNDSEASGTKETAAIAKIDADADAAKAQVKTVDEQTKRAKSSIQITLNDPQQSGNEPSMDDNVNSLTQEQHSPGVELRRGIPASEGQHDAETTERLSVVRARLQQFEVIANKTTTKVTPTEHDDKSSTSDFAAEQPQDTTAKVNQPDANIEQQTSLEDGATMASSSTTTIDIQINEAGAAEIATDSPQAIAKEELQIDEANLVAKPTVTELAKPDETEMHEDEQHVIPVDMQSNEDLAKELEEETVQSANDEPMQVTQTNDVVNVESVSSAEAVAKSAEESTHTTEKITTGSDITAPVEEVNESIEPAIADVAVPEQPTAVGRDDISDQEVDNNATLSHAISKTTVDSYPKDLDPFKSDDDDNDEDQLNKENVIPVQMRSPQPRTLNISQGSVVSATKSPASLNPFDSSDDEIELEKAARQSAVSTPLSGGKVPPPRPPPPRISRNPFGEEPEKQPEDNTSFSRRSSLSSSLTKTRTPVPTPRSNISQSQNPTPEPTPRLSNKTAPSLNRSANGHGDYYGSENSLTPHNLHRNSELRSSNNSLASSAGGTMRARKARRAPLPPGLMTSNTSTSSSAPAKELFPSTETLNSSMASSPSTSTRTSPRSARKKRPAPAPPKPARLDHAIVGTAQTGSKNSFSYPLQSELDSKLSDEEKALLEGKPHDLLAVTTNISTTSNTTLSRQGSRRIIPLDASLLDDVTGEDSGAATSDGKSDDFKTKLQQQGETESGDSYIIYRRRKLVPPKMDTPTGESNPLIDALQQEHDRQLEKLKDNKEAQNRNRQSQISSTGSSIADELESALYYNKSAHGKWKRRKGPAPALPVPPRKVLQMLPLQEIRQELEIIEVQQQGLEKQGVILEKMIRDRCEDEHGQPIDNLLNKAKHETDADTASASSSTTQNSKEVEDLILQLFELVNEKNELFRRQAELMYLRRQHRLEQEQADLEYEIRVLMAQPERNKTDTDKAREEALIARLVEVVQQRNDVVERLEMDRLRENEEDMMQTLLLRLRGKLTLKSKLSKYMRKFKGKIKLNNCNKAPPAISIANDNCNA